MYDTWQKSRPINCERHGGQGADRLEAADRPISIGTCLQCQGYGAYCQAPQAKYTLQCRSLRGEGKQGRLACAGRPCFWEGKIVDKQETPQVNENAQFLTFDQAMLRCMLNRCEYVIRKKLEGLLAS